MPSSSTYTFTLPIDELLSEASQRVGGEPVGGAEAEETLRVLNLFFTDLSNRGFPLHLVERVEQALTTAVATVTPTATTQDIMHILVRRASIDYPLKRMTYEEYQNIPNKFITGRPIQFYVDRRVGGPVVYLWPQPENATDVLTYLRVRYIQDSGALRYDTDFPRRFFPALVSGLAYFLGMRRYNFPLDKLQWLKNQYEEDVQRAMEEDRERASFYATPKLGLWR